MGGYPVVPTTACSTTASNTQTMVKAPTLRYGSDNDLKIKATLQSGRYWFTLSADAVFLLDEAIGYPTNQELPFSLFKTLVITGDAYLPNHSDPESVASDLPKPDHTAAPKPEAVEALSDHLAGNAYKTSQIKLLNDLQPELEKQGGTLCLDSVENKSGRVRNLQNIAEDL